MAEFHNRIDLALVSTGPTEIIDICEPGGIQNAHVVVEGDGMVTIEGCASEDGVFATVDTVSIPDSGVYRARIPLDWPRFIRLAAPGATLSIRA
jgi:hypothetical protein